MLCLSTTSADHSIMWSTGRRHFVMFSCWVRKTSSFIIDGLDNKYSIKDKTNRMYLKRMLWWIKTLTTICCWWFYFRFREQTSSCVGHVLWQLFASWCRIMVDILCECRSSKKSNKYYIYLKLNTLFFIISNYRASSECVFLFSLNKTAYLFNRS